MSEKHHGKQFAAPMSDSVRAQLLEQQSECTFVWQGQQDAMGTVMSFLWADGCVWLTTNDTRPRVAAVRKHRRTCVVVSSAGTTLGNSRCISLRGSCEVVDSREKKDWFYPAFCRKLFPENPRAAQAMHNMLDRDGQVLLCLRPDSITAYDGKALMDRLSAL